jgi:NAD(P)-dependent dehydrogenase (short-subunit alcohol dehydrogenase family)
VTRLQGRHALVTGANRGLGEAIAHALAAEGASVTLLVRDRGAGEAVARTLGSPSGVVVADVTDETAVRRACAEAERQSGPVDILVNNAGSAESSPFLKTSPDTFARLFAVHVLGAVHTAQAVLPGMIERQRGSIVNVASLAGLQGAAYVTAYTTAKHALVGLTRALALEVQKHGIAVNAVCPGYADTDMVRAAVARITTKTGRSEAEALASLLASAGQTRFVTVDEVSAAVLALCTAPSGAPVGQAVVIDGSSGA